ncbi:hypothetical protein D9M70_612020 [compost metagenome]
MVQDQVIGIVLIRQTRVERAANRIFVHRLLRGVVYNDIHYSIARISIARFDR